MKRQSNKFISRKALVCGADKERCLLYERNWWKSFWTLKTKILKDLLFCILKLALSPVCLWVSYHQGFSLIFKFNLSCHKDSSLSLSFLAFMFIVSWRTNTNTYLKFYIRWSLKLFIIIKLRKEFYSSVNYCKGEKGLPLEAHRIIPFHGNSCAQKSSDKRNNIMAYSVCFSCPTWILPALL